MRHKFPGAKQTTLPARRGNLLTIENRLRIILKIWTGKTREVDERSLDELISEYIFMKAKRIISPTVRGKMEVDTGNDHAGVRRVQLP